MNYGTLNYETAGSGSPVLIIHGWGIDHTVMQAAFEPVFTKAGGYKRYYVDLPGMGLSECGSVKNSDDILEMLYSFASDVIKEPFMLVGQSYGGLLARGFIRKYPEYINKLILLCPCMIPGVQQGRTEPLKARARDEKLLSALSEEEYDSFTQMNVMLTEDVWIRYRDILMPALARADWDFLNNVLDGSFSFDPDDIDECTVPCLIMAAKGDSVVGYKDQFDLMGRYTNSTYAVIENAGHNLQIEQPEIFESTVSSWLMTH